MKLTRATDLFIDDMRSQGRINSPATERDYRGVLKAHAEDVENRDPRYTNREDVKCTLRRWTHPNSQRKQRSILVSFYDWMVEEGMRPTNPARQTRRPKRRPSQTYRLTREEVLRLVAAARGTRERRAICLGVYAGLRSAELRGLRGEHFERPGFIWIDHTIAKGGRERFVPIPPELVAVVADIRRTVARDHFVLPAQRWRNPGQNTVTQDLRTRPMSPRTLWELVRRVGQAAGIAHPIHPHLMRHAYAHHMARHAGVRSAQQLLGHAGIATTQGYLDSSTPDELQEAVEGFTFGVIGEQAFYPLVEALANPVEAPTRIELV